VVATAGDRNLRDGSDTDQHMKKADLALYISKTNGGSVYLFFEEQMEAAHAGTPCSRVCFV
jgi:predicted signal transduction protein with EAL and GGDEF domain